MVKQSVWKYTNKRRGNVRKARERQSAYVILGKRAWNSGKRP